MIYLCAALISSGAAILTVSLLKYYRLLVFMKNSTYEEKTFNNWIYSSCFFLIVFFLIGYIFILISLFTIGYSAEYIIVSFIFFFGALFVFSMIRVQEVMVRTITTKTYETIQSMIYSMEAKDFYTKGHSEHVFRLVEVFYEHLPQNLKNKINSVKLKDAAMLHDIGKIGIPDGILNKPGKLTEEEMEVVKQHPKNGKNILDKTSYHEIGDWVLYHHERIDGNGYYGIPENGIPIESKIIAVADTFSALYTDRVYRKKFSYDQAIQILTESAGTQLDSSLVDIFCGINKEEIDAASM